MVVSKIPFKSLNNKVQFIFQICFFLGGLNQIAQLCSVLFLLSYASVNLACLGLVLSSAPNFRYVQCGLSFRGFFFYQILSHRIFCFGLFFVSTLRDKIPTLLQFKKKFYIKWFYLYFRPTFKYFSWHTSLVGLIGTSIMMFLISPIFAAVAILLCLSLILALNFLSPARNSNWGSISQALIFHQVGIVNCRNCRMYFKCYMSYWKGNPLIVYLSNNKEDIVVIKTANF